VVTRRVDVANSDKTVVNVDRNPAGRGGRKRIPTSL